MYLVFDTETTGLPKNYNAPVSDTDNWPRVVQLAWQLHDEWGQLVEQADFIIRPEGFNIPISSQKIHGISTELAEMAGEDVTFVLSKFENAVSRAKFLVGHNVSFDINSLGCEFVRLGVSSPMEGKPVLDTCTEATASLLKLPGGKGGKFKLPTLTELYSFLFDEGFAEAHNATADVEATTRAFLELIRLSHFEVSKLQQPENYIENFQAKNPESFKLIGLKHVNLQAESEKLKSLKKKQDVDSDSGKADIQGLSELPFGHLHNHTQFTILQSTSKVSDLVNRAAKYGMEAVALTDNGNMMAAFHFEQAVAKFNEKWEERKAEAEANGAPFNEKPLIPIIGCEFNVCENRLDREKKDKGHQVVFLAKNKKGYQNLIKLASIAYTEGNYYLPRIDKEVIEKYKSDLIVLSGNLNGEIPYLVLQVGDTQAENALIWWKEQFGEDFYIEINRHGLDVEEYVNETLVSLAQKHNVKIVATNNTYYLDQKDAQAHDVLLCVKEGNLVETPIGRGRGYRFGLENDQYYFKTKEEMINLFQDLPEALESVSEIIAKCEPYPLRRDVLLPAFEIPDEFKDERDADGVSKHGENNFLRHLTYEGAKQRYGEITDEIKERIDFELATIERTGYPGYFLIVQDFCREARKMGVSVGPGRGSAAGSAVAYCIGITNVDPIKYDLLFERFLNPDRVSMPDIDIDFDDEGREKVIDYVIKKYGANQVAQIITYGTMAAKSSIRDTGRVMNLPLSEVDSLAKMLPDEFTLNQTLSMPIEDLEKKAKRPESVTAAINLRKIAEGEDLHAAVLRKAKEIEGSVRNTGIHACGVIITPDDITNFVPVATAKDSAMVCTQFDNSVAESAGLLKMDFLGLKTLTLIKETVRIVKERHGIDLDPDTFPIDDPKTYELFQKGETVGVFQYESPGMQKYMKQLKPTVFADLIAMNALYRPGPLEYIPSFIRRKNGEEEITYDLAANEEYLAETYGITVYQEQVMLLSQKLANFSKGDADVLRKAMGKKQKAVLDKMKSQFIEGAQKNGHPVDKLEKIWKDWEAFAQYAFNKSHSTCYAWVAYQTAYLKANYPAEYMAAVLSNNMNDLKQVTFFMAECQRMGIEVLGPDVNESKMTFTVNKEGAIRFGLAAIRGIGSGPVESIIEERTKAPFKTPFDLVRRVNLRQVNKRVLESLVAAGAMDSLGTLHRAQYFHEEGNGRIFLETILRYGAGYQENQNSSQANLFGDSGDSNAMAVMEPNVPQCPQWTPTNRLRKEKEVIGIFISGHPLDEYKWDIDYLCNGTLDAINNPVNYVNRELIIPFILIDMEERTTKKGGTFLTLTMEDFQDTVKYNWFDERTFMRYKHFLVPGTFLVMRGRIEKERFKEELRFNIQSIDLLSKMRDNFDKTVKLELSASEIDQIMVQWMYDVLGRNQGNVSFVIDIQDELEKLSVRLSPRGMRLNLSNELIKELAKKAVKVSLN
jgi:DNA polymerase III subunit alpha